MAKYGPAASPDDDEFVEAVERHYPYDETVLGGVPTRVIAEEVGVAQDTAQRHCKRLANGGFLELIEARVGHTFAPPDDDSL